MVGRMSCSLGFESTALHRTNLFVMMQILLSYKILCYVDCYSISYSDKAFFFNVADFFELDI